jgi:hypothetical protein
MTQKTNPYFTSCNCSVSSRILKSSFLCFNLHPCGGPSERLKVYRLWYTETISLVCILFVLLYCYMYTVCSIVLLYVYCILFVLFYCYMYTVCSIVLLYVYCILFVLLYCYMYTVYCLYYCTDISIKTN